MILSLVKLGEIRSVPEKHMIRRSLVPLLLLVVVLAACQVKTPVVTEVDYTSTAVVTVTLVPTKPPAIQTDSPTLPDPTQAASDLLVPVGCTVISPRPTPGPTQQSPVGESDWVKGPETAAVTLIEYSDFQ